MEFNQSSYELLSDNELIKAVQAHDSMAFEALHNRYLPVMKRWKRYAFRLYPESEDYFQEVAICLFQAVYNFDVQAGASFGTYYSWSVYNLIRDHMRRNLTMKRRANVEPLSLQNTLSESNDSWQSCLTNRDPLFQPDYFISLGELMTNFYASLSDLELTVFQHYVRGNSWYDIALTLNTNEQRVMTAYDRSRRKFIKLMYKQNLS